MTTPTPSEADKRAAKRIIGVYAEYDLESVAQTERIIAEEMATEREAHGFTEWLKASPLRTLSHRKSGMFQAQDLQANSSWQAETLEALWECVSKSRALAAIEKVIK